MYTLISGSPKPFNSNSMSFLKTLSEKLDKYKIYELKNDKHDDILDNIKKSDAIVFAFPLYVDSPTSITLSFLDYLMDKKINLKNKLIYVIVNCGFREGEQNITAVNIIKNWCNKIKATYASSLMIGAGEIVGKEKFKFVSKKALRCLNRFINNIKLKQKGEDIITTMDLLNNKLYCYFANKSWTKDAKLNNLTESDVRMK